MVKPLNMHVIGEVVFGTCPVCLSAVTKDKDQCETCKAFLGWSTRPLTFLEKWGKLNGK